MILVVLGTQDKTFERLLDAVANEIDKGFIKEKVIVQAGYTKYEHSGMEMFDLIPMKEFDRLISECDILITHGGVGSIVGGLKNNKKIIAAPRLSEYNEHTNDHQLQIIEEMEKKSYLIGLYDFNKLAEAIENVKKLKPKKYVSTTDKIINLVEEFIG